MRLNIVSSFPELRENYYLDSMIESEDDSLKEAPAEPEPPAPEAPIDPSAGAMPALPGGDPSMGGDPAMGGFGGDPSMGGGIGGFGETEEIKTPTELGRIYELNKIYYRMFTIHKILRNNPDKDLDELKKMTSEAFDIYRLILNNIKSYKDQVDNIILTYYEFIGRLILILKKYYIEKSKKFMVSM